MSDIDYEFLYAKLRRKYRVLAFALLRQLGPEEYRRAIKEVEKQEDELGARSREAGKRHEESFYR